MHALAGLVQILPMFVKLLFDGRAGNQLWLMLRFRSCGAANEEHQNYDDERTQHEHAS
ncbi:hypothetical protein MCBRY_000642 [Methylocystis bryophila]